MLSRLRLSFDQPKVYLKDKAENEMLQSVYELKSMFASESM